MGFFISERVCYRDVVISVTPSHMFSKLFTKEDVGTPITIK